LRGRRVAEQARTSRGAYLARSFAADADDLSRDTVAPQVHVEELLVDGAPTPAGDRIALPASGRRLELRYTGVSLRAGERVRFQYRLDGFDGAWVDAGTARAVSYTRLASGTYRFRLRAQNADGVWNAREAALAVDVPPLYRTWWFATIATVGLVAALAAAHRVRERTLRARFAAVLEERGRVARELHDTLLGGMTGIGMRLDVAAAKARGPQGIDAPALEEVRDLAYHTLTDARHSVWDLRTLAAGTADLRALLDEAARRTFADTPIEVRVEHVGTPRPYAPFVEAQVFRITSEALTNARKHSDCRSVVVTCTHRRRDLRLVVRDDGPRLRDVRWRRARRALGPVRHARARRDDRRRAHDRERAWPWDDRDARGAPSRPS
jgi:signal transduction histidine kinase